MITEQNVLELEARRNIYNFILSNPGLHFRELERKLEMPPATLTYHLNFLKKRNLLIEEKSGRYCNFFVKEKVGRRDKKLISLLNKKIYRYIIIYLLGTVFQTRNQLIDELDLDIHPNTMTYHLKKLQRLDIIEIAPINDGIIIGVEGNLPKIGKYTVVSNENLYRLKDPQFVYDVLLTYQNELNEDVIMNFILDAINTCEKEGYAEVSYNHPRPEKVDRFLEKIHTVFPHPYHV